MANTTIYSRYGLPDVELLGNIDTTPRLKKILEQTVADAHIYKHLEPLIGPIASRLEERRRNHRAYWLLWLNAHDELIRVRCKIAFRRKVSTAYNANAISYYVSAHDSGNPFEFPENRLYSADHFQILGVCLGTVTSMWDNFLFARTVDLAPHPDFPHRLAPVHELPDPSNPPLKPWYADVTELFNRYDEPPLKILP